MPVVKDQNARQALGYGRQAMSVAAAVLLAAMITTLGSPAQDLPHAPDRAALFAVGGAPYVPCVLLA